MSLDLVFQQAMVHDLIRLGHTVKMHDPTWMDSHWKESKKQKQQIRSPQGYLREQEKAGRENLLFYK